MTWRTYDYLCKECGYRYDEIFRKGEQPETLDCEACGAEASMKETIGAPMPLRASYHDGYKRGGDYQLVKEAAKLEAQAANLPHDKRKGINKEVKTLRQRATRESSKPKSNKE